MGAFEGGQTASPVRGRIVEIERFAVHDGPGIRTTVFLKGCPLRCLWCHNPEAMKSHAELSFVAEKCIACGECVTACPAHLHALEGTIHTLDRSRCRACGACVEVCAAHSLELVGREWTVDEVMAEVLRDRVFYQRSGGGLTISGGEPLLQIEFTVALLRSAKAEGLHCCIETSGSAPWESLDRVRPIVDLFLYDCKETNSERHMRYTGQPNERILQNLRKLYESGAEIALQCPIIPGCNDTETHFAGIAALANSMPRLQGVRILPYHAFGRSKSERFGLVPASGLNPELPSRARVESWITRIQNSGVHVLNDRTDSQERPKESS
jgi:pyruvate formate lyase activating enzyme